MPFIVLRSIFLPDNNRDYFQRQVKGGEPMRTDNPRVDKHIKRFKELVALQEEVPTAWQLIWKLINHYKRWNCRVFCERTGLDQDVYYRAKRNDKSVPNIQTLMIICVHMELDKNTADELLAAAGIRLSKAIPSHRAYMYVIYVLADETIAVRCEFLNRLGFGRPRSRKSVNVKTL